MTFPTGLCVVEWSEAIVYALSLIELGLISLMGGVVHYAVAFVIESCRCGRILWASGSESNTKQCHGQ